MIKIYLKKRVKKREKIAFILEILTGNLSPKMRKIHAMSTMLHQDDNR